MTKTTTGKALRDGMTYRTLDLFTKKPVGPWVKADRVLPAKARGYLVIFVLGERNTRSLQTTTPIEIQG